MPKEPPVNDLRSCHNFLVRKLKLISVPVIILSSNGKHHSSQRGQKRLYSDNDTKDVEPSKQTLTQIGSVNDDKFNVTRLTQEKLKRRSLMQISSKMSSKVFCFLTQTKAGVSRNTAFDCRHTMANNPNISTEAYLTYFFLYAYTYGISLVYTTNVNFFM